MYALETFLHSLPDKQKEQGWGPHGYREDIPMPAIPKEWRGWVLGNALTDFSQLDHCLKLGLLPRYLLGS